MTAPNRPELVSVAEQFGPADVELVARALARRFCRDGRDPLVFLDAVAPGGAEPERADARAVLTALAGAGRLRPPDADTRREIEYAVQEKRTDSTWTSEPFYLREHAKARARAGDVVVQREIVAGPWVPVPTPKES